jgi:hypothetical protein
MEGRGTAHTADNCGNALAEVCSERAVNQGLWPSRSPDLYPCVFCLRCTLKLAQGVGACMGKKVCTGSKVRLYFFVGGEVQRNSFYCSSAWKAWRNSARAQDA